MITADLTRKQALVTGGASGIGLATVEMLARSGARVALNHLPGDEAGPRQVDRLCREGLDVVAAPGSVSKPGESEEMVETAIETLGGLDFLVNNAGTAGVKEPVPANDLDAMTEELWSLLLNTNLLGPFRCSRAAAPVLRAARGAIVNTASTAGIGKQGSSTAYAASKSGLVSLTRSLARGLSPDVRVNAVAPAQVRSPWTEGWSEERKRWVEENSLLGRRCEPEDIAEAILFLCAGAANMTGQTIVIDGGLTL